ncbi:MAG: hypothetical protein Q4C01_02445 [Clostridia bacterium]|nr:hypothetical protein [Clostridia bacterium]
MDIEGRRIADREALKYRERLAYIRGFEQGMGENTPISSKYVEARKWVWVIERVRAKLACYSPQKEKFFAEYYGLDRPLSKYETKRSRIYKIAAALYVGESTLYKWKEQILDDMLLAAVQAGLYKPF